MIGLILLVISVVVGIFLGLTFGIPYTYSKYLAVAILACLDSIFGGVVGNLEKKFSMKVFLTGFFGNALIAIFLVFIGEKLNVDIYLAAVIVFSTRLFNNFTAMRRILIEKIDVGKKKKDTVEVVEKIEE